MHLQVTGTTRINETGIEIVDDKPYISSKKPVVRIPGLHVLEIYQRFPCFDSYDYAYEDRYYRAFFFSAKPFTKEEITHLACMKQVFYPQSIAEWALPAVFHSGESEKMIIAY